MRLNLPVTGVERSFAAELPLVSTTDLEGRITHCNAAFAEICGYAPEELLGELHSVVRHPDTPPELFAEMWGKILRGAPWTGVLLNRCKNGDHYWVVANVTPVLERGRTVGFMSVRLRPTEPQIREAERRYAELARRRGPAADAPRPTSAATPRTGGGEAAEAGLALRLTGRWTLLQAGLTALTLAPLALELPPPWAAPAQVAAAVVAALIAVTWFHRAIAERFQACLRAARRLAGCDLAARHDDDARQPLGPLLHAIWLANLNMRAIVHDVRHEIRGISTAAAAISRGGRDLAARAEQQSADVQLTAATMEQTSRSVQAAAQGAADLERAADLARRTARGSSAAVDELLTTMIAIERATRAAADTIELIEGIANQTDLLSRDAADAAARAGEEGIAFAVVATRIGGLAHRSREAAREVATLISSCAVQVAEGSRRAGAAQASVAEAVESVNRVAERLAEIVAGNDEQARGVAEVSAAMSRIGEVAGRNAVLAERSARASQALEARTATLARAMKSFRTDA